MRKLLAGWIESPIQRAATAQPGEYQACEAVVVESRSPQSETGAVPQIDVRFEAVELGPEGLDPQRVRQVI